MTQNSVRIFEMSPRDGLQNEPLSIPTAAKVTLINLLSKCGFADIEATSFVSPKWVPQLADGAAVMAAISDDDKLYCRARAWFAKIPLTCWCHTLAKGYRRQ